jgi:hypothetical protein
VDYYDNPETVNNEDLGGDNQAGLTDNGRFEKYAWGRVATRARCSAPEP